MDGWIKAWIPRFALQLYVCGRFWKGRVFRLELYLSILTWYYLRSGVVFGLEKYQSISHVECGVNDIQYTSHTLHSLRIF
jgi:hypothetical protein